MTMGKHRAEPATRSHSSRLRTIVSGFTFLAATVTLSLLATSGTYALWSGASTVNGSTISTGSIGLTVNGATNYAIPNLNASKLAPGRSVTAAITLANTGSTPIDVSVTNVTVGANTNALAAQLTLRATAVANAGACTAGLTGGTTAALTAFTTSTTPLLMAAGTSQVVCLELGLSATAPASVQNGSTSFTLNMVANQRRP
jgi:Camelysin metallo-endopeptidase